MSWLDKWLGRTGDGGLHTEIRGQGVETLVFISGLGGTTRYWASRLQSIEDRYRIVLVDLLGFGESPKPWTRYSVGEHVVALHKALQYLGPISLVGHSLGALLTVAYASQFPEQVHSITVIGMPNFGSTQRAYRYFRHGPVRGGIVYTNVVLTMVACVITRRLLGKILPYVVRSVPREVAEDLVKHTWRSSTSSLWEVVYRYDAARDLQDLPPHIRVLLIHGGQDLMAPLDLIEELANSNPRWRLCVMPCVDHHPFLRDPKGCLAMIDRLVRDSSNADRQPDSPRLAEAFRRDDPT